MKPISPALKKILLIVLLTIATKYHQCPEDTTKQLFHMKQAMEDEMDALGKNKTFTLVSRQQQEKNPVGIGLGIGKGWVCWSRKV